MKRRPELDYMNAAACLLVILIHVLSVGIVEADPASWQAAAVKAACSYTQPGSLCRSQKITAS